MNEAWCPVPGYKNRYRISNSGRLVCVSNGTEREIVLHENHRGYMKATLYNGIRLKTFAIHRLVAMCFLNNPNHYPEVNHINEDKHDNRAENLEWCTRQYNVHYGLRTRKQKAKVSKPVTQYDRHGNLIASFCSTVQAGRELGLSHSSISACCLGKRKTCGGYRWQHEQ